MTVFFDRNPTREQIIFNLKKSDGMSIDDLSKIINITPMGIRQHLLALEKKGIVTYTSKKHGIGRPGYVYRLTESADALFPKSYDNFALGILKDIEKQEGKEKVDKIFEWRRDRIFDSLKEALADKTSIDERVLGLQDILKSEGYNLELSRQNDSYYLTNYNCPINNIALEYPSACKNELALFRSLISDSVQRTQCLSEGDRSCLFVIPTA